MQSQPTWVLDYQGQEYPIPSQGVRLGRGQDNGVVIQDDQVSRHHAIIWDAQGVVFVRDEGSTNGTYVNGKRVSTQTPLRPGDRVQIGKTVLGIRAAANGAMQQRAPSVEPISSAPQHNGLLVAGIIGLGGCFLIGAIILIATFISSSKQLPPLSMQGAATLARPSTPALALVQTTPTATPAPPATITPDADPIERARLAAVLIVVPDDARKDGWVVGSGSIFNSRGFILTNFHVVRNKETGGKPYNGKDEIFALIQSSSDKPPDRAFLAQVISQDSKLDLAVIKLIATDEGRPIPADLKLTVIPIGDSDAVKNDQDIRAIGFQQGSGRNLRESTVTLVRGGVSGFVGNREWIKTDAPIDHGISGGLAINLAGELIGVPTLGVEKVGYIIPINFAKPMMQQVK